LICKAEDRINVIEALNHDFFLNTDQTQTAHEENLNEEEGETTKCEFDLLSYNINEFNS